MKRNPTIFIFSLCFLILLSSCGNGRTAPASPNAANANNAAQQANTLATQAAAVIAEQANASVTKAAATVVAQTEAIATQAADQIANEGEALATQAADVVQEGEALPESSSIPITLEPGSLAEKFATIPVPSGDGTVEVTVTEAELNQAIAAAQAANTQAGTSSIIQNPQVRLTGGLVILTGTIAEPVSGQLTVSFSPYVVNGALQFEVVEATVGNFRVPPAVLQTAEETLNGTLGTAMSQLPASTGLQSVTVGEGTMTMVVIRT